MAMRGAASGAGFGQGMLQVGWEAGPGYCPKAGECQSLSLESRKAALSESCPWPTVPGGGGQMGAAGVQALFLALL